MLLYDITYPHSRDMDSRVSWGYLAMVAKNLRNEGAVAVCVNGEADVMELRGGQWIDRVTVAPKNS